MILNEEQEVFIFLSNSIISYNSDIINFIFNFLFNIMNTLSLPYMINRRPGKYGGQQEDYQRRTRALMAWGARQIKETPKEEKALVQLFFRLLEHFCKERQAIAQAHHTHHAEQFGRRRDLAGKKDFYHTILDEDYQEYNPKILAILAQHMRDMPIEKKNVNQKSKKTVEDTSSGGLSTLEIEVFENEELINLQWLKPAAVNELPPDFPVHLMDKRDKEKDLSPAEWQTFRQAVKKMKEANLPLYKRMKMAAAFTEMQKNFPPPQKFPQKDGTCQFIGKEGNLKSFFVLATVRLRINEKMYAVTQYLTWLYRDFATHPIDRMLKDSTVIVLHQDNFLIDDTLQEIARLFAKALLSKEGDFDELTRNVGLFRYYFASDMPCERGSSAISEYFEGSIYGAQDLEVTYHSKKQVDLEGLTSPFVSLFLKNYESMVKLTPVKRL
jgi:hypothetical protein